jgi:hypothetical protein
MARRKNPRRIVLEQVRDFKRMMDRLVNRWNVSSTVYTHGTKIVECDPKHYPHRPLNANGKVDVEMSDSTTRKRNADEYPENLAWAWAELFNEMNELEQAARTMKDMAKRRYWATKTPDEVAPCGCARINYNGKPAVEHDHGCLDGQSGIGA